MNPLLGGASRKPPSKPLPCQRPAGFLPFNTKCSGPHLKLHCTRDKIARLASKANPNPEPSPAPSCRSPGSEMSRDASATGQNQPQPRHPPSSFPFQRTRPSCSVRTPWGSTAAPPAPKGWQRVTPQLYVLSSLGICSSFGHRGRKKNGTNPPWGGGLGLGRSIPGQAAAVALLHWRG